MNDELTIEIDRWLKSKSQSSLNKYWRVVTAIQEESELRDDNVFKLPHHKFKDIDYPELEAIIVALHNKKFIEVARKLNETPPGSEMAFSIWDTVDSDPEGLLSRYSNQTQLTVNKERFSYLYIGLKSLADGGVDESTEVLENGVQVIRGWSLEDVGEKACIKKNGEVRYTFKNKWANKYRYFKCLWESYGKPVLYKKLYEYESNMKYPTEGIWKVNRNIRNIMNKFRTEIKSLPIEIRTSKGFTLKIK